MGGITIPSLGGRRRYGILLVLACISCSRVALAAAQPAPGKIEEFPVSLKPFSGIYEIAFGPEGDLWYVETEWREQKQFASVVRRISSNGIETAEVPFPSMERADDIARGPDDNMWLTTVINRTGASEEPDAITRISPAQEVESFTIPNPQAMSSNRTTGPLAIAPGPGSQMWFTDKRADSSGQMFIGAVTLDGATFHEFPVPRGESTAVPEWPWPTDLAEGADGNIWFTDDGVNVDGQNLIGRITPEGEVTEYPIPTKHSEPLSIARGSDGNMWFTELGDESIGRITPDGSITEFPTPAEPSNALQGIVRGSDGNMWFAIEGGFASISPAGTIAFIHQAFPDYGYPWSLASGSGRQIWFSMVETLASEQELEEEVFESGRIGVLEVPYLPAVSAPPALEGVAEEGQVLTSSPGSWQNEPASIAIGWERCDGAGGDCESLSGAGAVRRLGPADVGHTIRSVVTASNVAGDAIAASAPSAVVHAPAAPPLPKEAQEEPIVGGTLLWKFGRHGNAATVRSFVVEHLSAGVRVRLTCSGHGCRRTVAAARRRCTGSTCRWTYAANDGRSLSLNRLFAHKYLEPGTHLSVVIAQHGHLGKAYSFTVGKHGQVAPEVTCRQPDSFTQPHPC